MNNDSFVKVAERVYAVCKNIMLFLEAGPPDLREPVWQLKGLKSDNHLYLDHPYLADARACVLMLLRKS